MHEQVQKAIDCYNAGATVLHVHVREEDGKGSKRIARFNEMIARLREAVPKMVLQIGGSISFAPDGEGQAGAARRELHVFRAPDAGEGLAYLRRSSELDLHRMDVRLFSQ